MHLCKGKKKEAVDLYRQSIASGELSKEQFMSIFAEDKALLISLGVNPDDLPILLDYLSVYYRVSLAESSSVKGCGGGPLWHRASMISVVVHL